MTIRAVHHLNCATLCPAVGASLGLGGGLGRGRLVAHCLLVETARDGLVLVETGLGTRDVDGSNRLPFVFRRLLAPALRAHETAIAQVRALGHDPDDVRHVVVTHLDLDHAGGLPDFPRARVHVHAREHAAAMARASAAERGRYLSAHWAHGPAWEVYAEQGDTWRGLPAIARLRGLYADVGLVPLHGHSRGHSAVIVRSGERWLVHAGDAYVHRAALDENARLPFALAAYDRATEASRSQRRASLAALRRLRASYPDVDVFSSHDPREYEALRAAGPGADHRASTVT